MAIIQDRDQLQRRLVEERDCLITAVRSEIAATALKDPKVSQRVVEYFTQDRLRDAIQLAIVLGGTQYYWLCYWRKEYGGAYTYDASSTPALEDVEANTDIHDITEAVGLSQSRLLYAEKVAWEHIIGTTYTDAAAKPVAGSLIVLYGEEEKQKQSEAQHPQEQAKPRGKAPIKLSDLDWKFWLALISAVAAVVMSPFVLDLDAGVIASLCTLVAMGMWWIWSASPPGQRRRILLSLAVVVVVFALVLTQIRSSELW